MSLHLLKSIRYMGSVATFSYTGEPKNVQLHKYIETNWIEFN